MKKVGWFLVGSLIATVSACDGSHHSSGGGNGYSLNNLCSKACDCYAETLPYDEGKEFCDSETIGQCVDDVKEAQDYVESYGCGDEFDAWAECMEDEGVCKDDGEYGSVKCDDESQAIDDCINGSSGSGGGGTGSGGGDCPYTYDGECDEPEGTGLCPEGSDYGDCYDSSSSTGATTTSTTSSSSGSSGCDGSGTCGDSTSGCIGCALADNCADEYDFCAATQDCIDFATCASSCADQSCYDDCASTYSYGASIYNDLLVCVICEECYSDCDGAGSGC